MNRLLLTISAAALALTSLAAQTTSKLTASKANEYGIIYTLPLTSFEITVAAEKTVSTPGEFYQYAKKYLNASPVTEPQTSWKITEAVINAAAVPDENERYLVTLKGGNNAYIMIDDNNFPLSINDDTYEAGVNSTPLPQAVAAKPTILEMPVARQAVSEEMLQSRSSAKRAELAAAKIYELRRNRNEIIAGQADAMPSDGQAMKLALAQLDDQEAALTAMFLGTTSTSVEVRTYTVSVPDDGTLRRTIFARLSALDGLVSPEDLSGDPIYVSITPLTRGELPKNEKGEEKTFPKGGVAYRIPGTANVKVDFDGSTLASKDFEVAQLGIVFGVAPSLFTSKKEPAYLHFNPLTGAIRELGTRSE